MVARPSCSISTSTAICELSINSTNGTIICPLLARNRAISRTSSCLQIWYAFTGGSLLSQGPLNPILTESSRERTTAHLTLSLGQPLWRPGACQFDHGGGWTTEGKGKTMPPTSN